MVDATTPDGIAQWEKSDPASLIQESSTQAASIQAAFNKRQRYHYVWADSTERDAEVGMVDGSTGYQLDTRSDYVWSGTAWNPWMVSAQTFTATWDSGFNPGTGDGSAWYSVTAGWAHVEYNVTMGTGFSVTGNSLFDLPPDALPNNTLNFFNDQVLGNGIAIDSSAGSLTYNLVVTLEGGSTTGVARVRGITAGAHTLANLSSTFPFTWGLGDELAIKMDYPIIIG